MSESKQMQVKYSLRDKERLFSIAYAIYNNRERLLQKGDKVQPFHVTLRTVLIQSVVLYAVAVVFLFGMMRYGFDLPGLVLLVLCVVYGMVMITSWGNNRRDFRYAQKRFLMTTGENGAIRFDQRGFTDVSAFDKETFYSWSEYRHCIIVDEAIVILFVNEREEMLLMSRDDGIEQALRQVLKEFDMAHTIRRAVMKGKKK